MGPKLDAAGNENRHQFSTLSRLKAHFLNSYFYAQSESYVKIFSY